MIYSQSSVTSLLLGLGVTAHSLPFIGVGPALPLPVSERKSQWSTGVWNHMHFCLSLAASEDQLSFQWKWAQVWVPYLCVKSRTIFVVKWFWEDQFSFRSKCAQVWAIYMHLCVKLELFFCSNTLFKRIGFHCCFHGQHACVRVCLGIAKGHYDVWISENPNQWRKAKSKNTVLWNPPVIHSSSSSSFIPIYANWTN